MIIAMEDCFSTLATFFFFGKWLWQIWQVGKVVQENMPPSRFVQLRRGPDVSACTLKMRRNDSKCCLAFALRGCEQRIIVFFLLGIFWITSKNMQWIGTDRNGYE